MQDLEAWDLSPLEDRYCDDDNESWLNSVSGGSRRSVPETPVEAIRSDDASFSRIIITMFRTRQTCLTDGSI
ncbi:uncharacterized protein N7473_013186 [Penicillium subrubescens]|uniref:uncharacterized protein n=1 Tax=Penicillium subrubescens TaxID=1316194 RepID=UPI0025453BA8|nr:uncharacterized protein N7473_013186 [Penicillium subrubescens]KAJ5873627.1 hypothetical protein N7473_013186 [Penicillium subrubescens]